ncbi:HpcH/HpaI aldolase/citrate lyase family protein [Roseibium aggregatum]|uniref:CoA ester lyase n=1 Tax=Roseibium aggregatum TaxID=187304 RepID=A0A939EJI5_9HYPH|nr:CoA ester lyase [Roseibium aggregatum]MBN9673881.1 CoA ester lyase [Roseibium aggregatum]
MTDLTSDRLFFPLFAPATRPERIDKARLSGASCVIADLEDAVAPEDKATARQALASFRCDADGAPVCVRINSAGTPWFEEDLAMVRAGGFAGVVLPKAEDCAGAEALRQALPSGTASFALIETALGLARARDLAPLFDRLFFGSLDYAADLGCAHTAAALAHARSELVLAARIAGKPGPVDGVTADTRDFDLIRSEAAYGAELGFKGKLLIHPAQLSPAKAGYRPDEDEISWASKVVAAIAGAGVAKVDGKMIDAPVVARARLVLARAAETAGE